MRECTSMAEVGSPCTMSKHHPMEFAWENSLLRAPQIEQEAKQQTTSPWREIQAAEPATLPTRRLARNAQNQACFGYNGTQGGGYVTQRLAHPMLSLMRNLCQT